MTTAGELGAKINELGLEYFGRYYGVYKAVVTDNADPQSQGRVKIKVPCLGREEELSEFAYPISPFAGDDYGFFFPPEVGALTWVVFENGNPAFPMYLGGWWTNPKKGPATSNTPPEARLTGKSPEVRVLKTKSGHQIFFDDSTAGGITIQTAGGTTMKMTEEDGGISITATGEVNVKGVAVNVTGNYVDVTGAVVRVNNGTRPAAAIGDSVSGSTIVGPPSAGRPLVP